MTNNNKLENTSGDCGLTAMTVTSIMNGAASMTLSLSAFQIQVLGLKSTAESTTIPMAPWKVPSAKSTPGGEGATPQERL